MLKLFGKENKLYDSENILSPKGLLNSYSIQTSSIQTSASLSGGPAKKAGENKKCGIKKKGLKSSKNEINAEKVSLVVFSLVLCLLMGF